MQKRILIGLKDAVKTFKEQTGEVDPLKPLLHSIGNVLNSVVLGVSFEADDPMWLWLQHLAEEGVKLIGVAGPLNFLPFLRWVPKFRKAMVLLVEGMEKTHEVYAGLVGEREGDESLGAAFLREARAGRGAFFDRPQLLHLLGDMWGAGVDTTLATLRWFLLYMAANPNIQKNVQEEIDMVLGDREWPSVDDHHHLPYTEACIAETQRIRSVVPLGFPHGARVNTEVEGYFVPKGAMVLPFQWAVHMNPDYYPDPEKFDPTRFIDESGKFFKPAAFLPFQSGKRVCVGEEMAKMLLSVFAVGLLRHFSLTASGDLAKAMRGISGITLSPDHHQLTFTPRLSPSL